MDFVERTYGLRSVTTASPLIAGFIKSNFPSLEVRASVNMSIGSVLGMEYVQDVFDSFYLARECNRDFAKIAELKARCEANGKQLFALANSGCLNHCSAHTFHDNLVSHESEIFAMDNGFAFEGVCLSFLRREENLRRIGECTSFIRPEDMHFYEGIFPAVKLATRVNPNPIRVLDAYIGKGSYLGSALDLLEPSHTGALYPYLLENSRIESEIRDGRLVYKNIDKALIKLKEALC